MSTSLALALAVSAGVAAGVFLNPASLWPARWLVAIFGVAAFLLAARGRMAIAKALAICALAATCALIGADAQHRALYPPLRQLLEARFGGFAIETLDLDRHDTPFEIEGRLMADAAITDAGANLRIQVDRVWIESCPEPASGGVSITVAGVLAAEAASEWRAGRRVRMPAVLRRPARYLNEGVADQELLLARRGIALVGSAKSAALVQVVEPGPVVRRMGVGDSCVGAQRVGAPRERARSAVGRGGRGDPDRRSRIARSGCRATPAGSGDVSRHRDLRRQHRHPRGDRSCRAVGDGHSRRLGGRRGRGACWRRMRTSPAQAPRCFAPP